MLYRITAPHFVAGFTAFGAWNAFRYQTYWTVDTAAPIIRYMVGWDVDRVVAYCEKKGWKLEKVE